MIGYLGAAAIGLHLGALADVARLVEDARRAQFSSSAGEYSAEKTSWRALVGGMPGRGGVQGAAGPVLERHRHARVQGAHGAAPLQPLCCHCHWVIDVDK